MSKDSNPFEDIGPGSEGSKKIKSENGPVKEAVKRARDFYNRDSVKNKVKKAERLFKVAKDVNTSNPFSWAHAVFKVADEFYEFEDVTMPTAMKKFNALKDQGHELTTENVTHLIVHHLDSEDIKELEKNETDNQNEGGPRLCGTVVSDGKENIPVFWYNDGFDYSEIVCSDEFDKDKAQKALSSLIWSEYGSEIQMIWGDDREFKFRSKDAHPWVYKGEFGWKLIERWKKAYQIDMRRFSILHGPPGTGKSTLARQLGCEIDASVLYVPVQTLVESNSIRYFSDTLEVIRPNVVIIDDIDRMSKSNLEKLLETFDETALSVPVLLATTNHLDRLPDAIKRPGRFDEIWEIDYPPKEVRQKVIRYLADLEGVELTDEQVGVIDEVSGERNLSGAHIREIVRRSVLDFETGWDSIDFDDRDLTFSQDWRPSQYEQEGISVHKDDEEE